VLGGHRLPLGGQRIDAVLEVLQRTGAIEYAREQARHEAECARAEIDALPASDYRDGLVALTRLAVDRTA
jgi:octaprenyl-diphosphate synthase